MRRYQLIPSHAVQTLIITTTSPITSGEVTLPYSFSFNAIGGTPPYTWSETGTLPTGFSLSSGGTLSGTPSATYANSFSVTVTDNIGSHYTASFNLTIVAAVSITTTSPLPNATESSSYSYTMAATGGFTPYTWSLLSSTGSNSWSVSPTGVVTGLPGSVEIDTLDIQVVDALGVPSAANFNLTVNSASGQTFDYYISTTGSDANAGSLASPWAVTSCMMASHNANNVANFALTRGKRIGFLPGTYNVSAYMGSDSFTGAMQIDSGTSAASTYYGSANSSGIYTVGTALITAETGGGLPGGGIVSPNGGYNGPIIGGCCNTPHTGGWITIDGLRFTWYSYKCMRIGGVSSGDGPAITGTVLIQNCEFFGQTVAGIGGSDNEASIWLDGTATVGNGGTGNYTVTNNWFHDNQGTGGTSGDQHLTSIFVFNCASFTITYNTGYNSGGLAWAKDSANQGATVAYNYVDMSMMTGGGGAMTAFNDFTGDYASTTGLTETSTFHHNIAVVYGAFGMCLAGAQAKATWQTPVQVYNNTIIVSDGSWPDLWAVARVSSYVTIYNNIITGSADSSGYGSSVTGTSSIAINDYNGYMTAMSWGLGANQSASGSTSGYPTSKTSTLATYKSAVTTGGGPSVETHSVFNNSPLFVATGTLAPYYQLQSGSPFKNVGSTNGTTGGSACDMGAWGGASPPTFIGCSFASAI